MRAHIVPTATVVAGIEIPSTSPVFLGVVGFHVLIGLACVVTGAGAMLSRKAPGRHPNFGAATTGVSLLSLRRQAPWLSCVGRKTTTCSCSAWGRSSPDLSGAWLVASAGKAGQDGISPGWDSPTS